MSNFVDDRRKAAVNGRPSDPPPPGAKRPWDAVGTPRSAPQGVTAFDLVAAEFEPQRFVLDGLLTEGLTVLGGKPKHGKSWLALLLAWAVAAGYDLDGRTALQGEVLYLALEDTRRRLQGRLRKLNAGAGWVVPETLELHTSWPRADDNGLWHIREWLDARKGAARLVIVDTLAKFRKVPKSSAGSSYAEDYEAVGGLKELVDHYGVSCLLITHTRKLRSDDPFDEISGTLAITGAADSIWMLDTREKGAEARVYVTGRDGADSTVPMSFTKDTGRWAVGASKDGIDTEGRESPGGQQLGAKVVECAGWLRDFLKLYAYPSREIETAAKAAGYSFSALRDAKASMGRGENGTKELFNHNYGGDKNNDWWSGMGPKAFWKLRPVPGNFRQSGTSGDSDRIPD